MRSLRLLGKDHVDLDVGVLSELLEQTLDEIRLAIGIDVNLLGVGPARLMTDGRGKGERKSSEQQPPRRTRLHC